MIIDIFNEIYMKYKKDNFINIFNEINNKATNMILFIY
jgi:hypothetical protein